MHEMRSQIKGGFDQNQGREDKVQALQIKKPAPYTQGTQVKLKSKLPE